MTDYECSCLATEIRIGKALINTLDHLTYFSGMLIDITHEMLDYYFHHANTMGFNKQKTYLTEITKMQDEIGYYQSIVMDILQKENNNE